MGLAQNMFLIASISCDYLKELTMTAYKPSVWVRTAKFGTKSFELEYLITSLDKEGNDIIHAKGKSTQVMFDTKSRQTMVIPEWLKEELTAYEKVI